MKGSQEQFLIHFLHANLLVRFCFLGSPVLNTMLERLMVPLLAMVRHLKVVNRG